MLRLCKDVEHVNILLSTQFKTIKVKKINAKFDKYNVDIVIQDENELTHIIEVDGVYFHGLDN